MRSKLGTKSRLAAHILALLLLILMLVYLGPAGAQVAQDAKHTPMRPTITLPPNTKHESGETARVAAESPLPPEERKEEPPVEEAPVAEPAAEEPVAIQTPVAEEEPAAVTDDNDAAEALVEEEPAPLPAEPAKPEPEEPVQKPVEPEPEPAAAADDTQTPPETQPDESGSLVVAGADASRPVAAATPLSNANLQVLGDGVYWLDSRHDLTEELGAIPEIGTLIFLTPLPGYHTQGFEHVKTEAIPADAADLTRDAAERYLHLTGNVTRPVVTAVVPGARGAAFFKGAYLLANRKMDMDELLREIEPELTEAGAARDEIIHRLMRLRDN